jgi:hypothetical protein
MESTLVSYGKATAYFPVLDLLKGYCHLDERDDPRTVRAQVTGQVLTLDATLQDKVSAVSSLLDALPDDSPFVQLDPSQATPAHPHCAQAGAPARKPGAAPAVGVRRPALD